MKTFKCFKGQCNSPKLKILSLFTHFHVVVHIICCHCFPFPAVFNTIPVHSGHVCEVAKRTNTPYNYYKISHMTFIIMYFISIQVIQCHVITFFEDQPKLSCYNCYLNQTLEWTTKLKDYKKWFWHHQWHTPGPTDMRAAVERKE